MKRTLITALLLLSLSATPALASPTLKQQLAAQRAKVAKLQSQLKKAKSAAKAQHRKDFASIADLVHFQSQILATSGQKDIQISTLTTQVQTQFSDAVSTILSGSPDQIYDSVSQIWNGFPKLPFGQACRGYDKSASLTVYADKSAASTFTFAFQPCSG
jgi:transcriptional regulator with AAA-type ATPase domain